MYVSNKQFNALGGSFAARADGALVAHIALTDEIVALGQAVLYSDSRRWVDAIEKMHGRARQCGFSTVALVAKALESELATGGRMRAIACYMDALHDALDMDATSMAGGGHINLGAGQEALLASLALRMHG